MSLKSLRGNEAVMRPQNMLLGKRKKSTIKEKREVDFEYDKLAVIHNWLHKFCKDSN